MTWRMSALPFRRFAELVAPAFLMMLQIMRMTSLVVGLGMITAAFLLTAPASELGETPLVVAGRRMLEQSWHEGSCAQRAQLVSNCIYASHHSQYTMLVFETRVGCRCGRLLITTSLTTAPRLLETTTNTRSTIFAYSASNVVVQ